MKNPEQEQFFKQQKALQKLKKTSEKEILNNPSFVLNDQKLTLDFLSVSDEKHLKKIFKLVNKLLKSNSQNLDKNFFHFQQSIADEITKIHTKENITVKEFEIKYNISKSSQQQYRGRLYDPLPYHQKVRKGKIVYVVEEVDKWFKNQHK